MRPRHRLSPLLGCSALCASLLFLGAGCANVYDVKVDALQNTDAVRGHAYRIVPGDPARAEADPAYEKAVGLVRNALSGHGMYEAPEPDEAEVEVTVDYGVGPARVVVQEEDPLFSEFGRPIVGRSHVRSIRSGILETGDPRVFVDEVYEKRLTIVARETSSDENQRPKELWRVEVRVEDKRDTVAEVLPVLVGAAVDHIDTDSQTQQRKRVSDKSEPVSFVKGGG
jgi:hypothetical protein